MAIVLAIVGVACVLYGVAIMGIGSGTWFFAVWYAIGAVFLAGAWAVHAGWWAAAPVVFRRVVEVACTAILVGLVVFCGMSASGFFAEGEDGFGYVIVLGAQVYDDRPSKVLSYRLDTARNYLERNPEAVCIVSGGQGWNEPCPEADVMAEYLVATGVDASRIVRERESANTAENIANSMRLIGPGSEDVRVGIVTNNFHIFRAVRIAHNKGLRNACGVAAPSDAWALPNNMLREALGIAKGFAQGDL